jgi:hypothetical protein
MGSKVGRSDSPNRENVRTDGADSRKDCLLLSLLVAALWKPPYNEVFCEGPGENCVPFDFPATRN